MHGLAVYMKEGLLFARDSKKLCGFVLMFSTGFTSLIVLLIFPLYLSPSSLCTDFDSVSSNADEVLSIKPSAIVFVFGDFNIHQKDWVTYFGGAGRPGEHFYNFAISRDLTQMVNFPAGIPDLDSHTPALLDLFISSGAGICSTMLFPPLGNSDHVVVSVSIEFLSNSQRDTPFRHIVYGCSYADWNGLPDHLRDVP